MTKHTNLLRFVLSCVAALFVLLQSEVQAAQSALTDSDAIDSSNVTRLQEIKFWEPDNDLRSPFVNITLSEASNSFLVEGSDNLFSVVSVDSLAFGPPYQFASDGGVWHRAISPNGQMGAVSDLTKIDIWDTETGELKFSIPGDDDHEINEISFSPNNALFAYSYANNGESTVDDDGIYVFDLASEMQLHFFTHPKSVILAFSPDSQNLVSGSFDGSVKLWNLRDETFSQLRPPDGNGIQQLEYLDSKTLAISALSERDRVVEFWDVVQHAELARTKHSGLNNYLKDGIGQTRLDDLISIQLWSAIDDNNLALIKGLTIEDFKILQGNLLITSSEAGLEFRKLNTGEIIHTLQSDALSFAHARLSFDRRYLVIWGTQGHVQIWGVRRG